MNMLLTIGSHSKATSGVGALAMGGGTLGADADPHRGARASPVTGTSTPPPQDTAKP